jgi:hypothetical protein
MTEDPDGLGRGEEEDLRKPSQDWQDTHGWKDGKPPPPNGEDHDPPPSGEVQIVQGTIRAITAIPPRQWAYGKFMLFGSAAVIGAMDGAGKGIIAVATALAFITGQSLLGEKVWRTGPVVIITYEDDQEEWERRIAAACLHYNLDYETIIASFYFLHKPNGRVTLAERQGRSLAFPDTARIVYFIKKIKSVLLIIDPFNSAHAMEDGNNNVAIAAVAQEITTIARLGNVAALLLHHLRKGAVGGIDDLMGAVALRANFRACRIFQVMDEGAAAGLGIPTIDAWRYLCVVGSKENYAPPLSDRMWFRKVSYDLNNPDEAYEFGDNVAAIARWDPPTAFEGLDRHRLRVVFDVLTAKPHARSISAKELPWVGKALKDQGRTTEQAKKIVNLWLQSDLLVAGKAFKTENRNLIQTVVPDAEKVAAMLAGMTAGPGGFGGDYD